LLGGSLRESELALEGRHVLVADNRRHIDRLRAVDVAARSFSDAAFVLSYAHAPIDVKRLGAHPPADKLDHGVIYAGCMEGGS
jgi:hypothetical protein